MCGNLRVPSHWKIAPRKIQDFHLLMVLGGKGTYFIDGTEVPLHRGRMVFVSQNVEYSAEQNLADPPHIIPVRFFMYDNRSNTQSPYLDEPVAVSYATAQVEKFQDMFESLHRQHLLNRGPFRTGYCSTIIHHILCDMLFECSDNPDYHTSRDARILKVQQFIADNPMDRSSVAGLARMAGLSEKYFTRLFRQQTGVTPKRYQLNSRLSRARVLLEHGMSVKETALQMEYPDPFVFSKQFKALLGISPSDVARRP
jgi:AraC-like DNA-binding protein